MVGGGFRGLIREGLRIVFAAPGHHQAAVGLLFLLALSFFPFGRTSPGAHIADEPGNPLANQPARLGGSIWKPLSADSAHPHGEAPWPMLLALGFTPRQVRRLLLGEGVALAFIGGVLGALGGVAYAKVMLYGLATIWRDAVGASALSFHATPQTLAIGLFAATVVGAITVWLALRKSVRRSARA